MRSFPAIYGFVAACCVVASVAQGAAPTGTKGSSAEVSQGAVPGNDWPSFRGADRSGVSKDTGEFLVTSGPKTGRRLFGKHRGADAVTASFWQSRVGGF